MHDIESKGHIEGPFLCIINPNSGRGKYREFQQHLNRLVPDRKLDVVESQSPDHSVSLAREAGSKGFTAVVAIGGDGSVHEIGTQLIGTGVALGIIPTGSGNGIARHLGLSMNIRKATEQILGGRYRSMDTLIVNDRKAIGFAGLGLDGHVAERFAHASERGLIGYLKLTWQEVLRYKPSVIGVNGENGKTLLSLMCSNVSQLGNNAWINPEADDCDGKFEVIAISPVSALGMIPLVARLFTKSFHRSPMVAIKRLPEITIQNSFRAQLHIDGEPAGCPENIHVKINPTSLKVIIP